jgi:hypothetical protein
VLFLPLDEKRLRQQKVRILCRLLAAIDDERRPDEALGRDTVDRAVRQVLARNPVNRRIEMRAGVLAAGKIVPVPGWPALVVVRHLLDAEGPGLSHLRRQRNRRELGRQRLGEIDHLDLAPDEAFGEIGERAHGVAPAISRR